MESSVLDPEVLQQVKNVSREMTYFGPKYVKLLQQYALVELG